MVAQNDAMSADMSGSHICSTMCALDGSAIHVFVVWQSNHKLFNGGRGGAGSLAARVKTRDWRAMGWQGFTSKAVKKSGTPNINTNQ